MTRRQRLEKNETSARAHTSGARASTSRSNKRRTHGKRPKMLNIARSSDPKKAVGLDAAKISEFYRPLKRPVTLRLDADVLAWFKREGKRYQTRINQALRQLMEREMKQPR